MNWCKEKLQIFPQLYHCVSLTYSYTPYDLVYNEDHSCFKCQGQFIVIRKVMLNSGFVCRWFIPFLMFLFMIYKKLSYLKHPLILYPKPLSKLKLEIILFYCFLTSLCYVLYIYSLKKISILKSNHKRSSYIL